MKRIASICLSIFVGLVSFSAAQDIPKEIKGGVLNGKAVLLPRPSYPPAARAVGASGAVTVQVLIDENGDVISASAVSGHPLLRAAAVEAARGAKFSPTRLSGAPVKVAGVVTYNFVGALQLARIAFIISHAERTSSFRDYSAPESLASQFPASWVQEKEILRALTFEETPKVLQNIPEKKPAQKPGDPPSEQPAPDANRYTIKGDVYFSANAAVDSPSQKLDSTSLASIQNLSKLIEVRASVNQSASWAYELGKLLGVLVADIEDRTRFESDLQSLESLSNRAPSGGIQYSLQQLKDFIEFAKKENGGDNSIQGIRSRVEALTNLQY